MEYDDGFEPVSVPGVDWPVFRDGSGPPVVVIHELMGLTPPTVGLARRLVGEGFTAYLPVLAGPPRARTNRDRYGAALSICVSREIHALRSGATSPAVGRLRTLAAWAAEQAGTPGAGVVGMCFSGGFAIAAACDESVLAGVAAQPSLPLRPVGRGDLGMDEDDVATVAARIARGETEIYLTRFTADWISPGSRAEEAVARLGTVIVDELDSGPGNPYCFRRGDHSVLAIAPLKYPAGTPAGDRLRRTYDDVVAFLHRRLTPGAAG